jgi:hypothetical protein
MPNESVQFRIVYARRATANPASPPPCGPFHVPPKCDGALLPVGLETVRMERFISCSLSWGMLSPRSPEDSALPHMAQPERLPRLVKFSGCPLFTTCAQNRSSTTCKTLVAIVLLAIVPGAVAHSVLPHSEYDTPLGERADVSAREPIASSADDHCVGWRISCKGSSARTGCTLEQLVNVLPASALCTFEKGVLVPATLGLEDPGFAILTHAHASTGRRAFSVPPAASARAHIRGEGYRRLILANAPTAFPTSPAAPSAVSSRLPSTGEQRMRAAGAKHRRMHSGGRRVRAAGRA